MKPARRTFFLPFLSDKVPIIGFATKLTIDEVFLIILISKLVADKAMRI